MKILNYLLLKKLRLGHLSFFLILICCSNLKAQMQLSNDNCEDATLLEIKPIGTCTEFDIVYNDTPNTFSGIPNCLDYVYYTLGETPYDLFHKVVVPPSGNFVIRKNNSIHLGIYDACDGNNLQCIYSNSPSEDIEIVDYTPGDTLLLQFIQYNGIYIEMCLEELPPSLENDLCENATPLCGALLEGSNELAFESADDPMVSCHNKSFDVKNTVWYSFTADDSGLPIAIYVNEQSCNVSYYGGDVNGFGGLSLGILSGSCNTLFEEYCTYFFANGTTTYILDLENPTAGTTYYVYISSHANADFCSYDITTSAGIETCCGPDVSLNPTCENIGDDNFYVDITLSGLGNNPSGYVINDGSYPDITAVGTSTIGPFPIGIATIKLTGKDDAACEFVFKVDSDCTPAIDNNSCSTPQPINVEDKGACSELTSVKVSDIGNNSGLTPSCQEEFSYYFGSVAGDRFYSFSVPPSGRFKINITGGEQTHAALYSTCEGIELECVLGITSGYDFLNFEAGEELILQLWQTGSSGTGPYTVCLEEVDPPPPNDGCENAIPLCGSKLLGSTEGISAPNIAIPNCSGTETVRNMWYNFVAATDEPIYVYFTDVCMGSQYLPYETGIVASLLEGNCETGFSQIDCIYTGNDFATYYAEPHVLKVQNPVPGNTYYLSIGITDDSVCSFEITTSIGVELCCGSDIALEQNCEGTDGESYSVDIVTANGISTVGPFTNGLANVVFGAPDDPSCNLEFAFNGECIIGATNVTCALAEPYSLLSVGGCASNYPGYNYFPTVNTKGAALDLMPGCLSGNPNNYTNVFHEVVVPLSGSFQYINPNNTGLSIYESCSGAEIFCKSNLRNEIFEGYTPGDTLLFQIWTQYNANEIGFCLQELPGTPPNDMCEDAIQLCIGTFSGSNIHATQSMDDFISSCKSPQNTVWYSFVPRNNGSVTLEISTTLDCINYFVGYGELLVSVFSGACGGPYVEEFCDEVYPYDTEKYIVENLVANQQYYIQMSSIDDLECNFDITIEEGIKPCCGPDITFTPSCPNEGEQDVFYVDIEITDLGENPTGYLVNNGNYPNITAAGITTVGPFINGPADITLRGLDIQNCVIEETFREYCNCSEINVSSSTFDELILTGDSITLFRRLPLSGSRTECETIWVTDLDNPDESTIGMGETFTLIPDSSTTIYGVTTCNSCSQHNVIYNIVLLDYENCDELTVASSSGAILFYGSYYDYYFTTDLSIEIEDTTSCEFLYWVTDLSDPLQSIVSTEENYTTNIPGGTVITYYGVVACEDYECAEAFEIITPIFDFYSPPPPPPPGGGEPDEPGQPGTPGSGEDDGIGNLEPCSGITAGTLNTLDKYVCFGEVPDVTLNNVAAPSGYSIYYAYHNTSELSAASVIYSLSLDDLVTPENVLPCGITMYLTAFIAPTVNNLNAIDLNNSCSISNTIEITYLCPVQIQVQEICNNNGTYNLVVTITGGLPQVLGNLPFSIYGTVYKGNVYHNETFTISNLPDGSSYQIEALDSEMCHDWVSGTVQCDKLPVELLTFEGEAQENGNLLKWSTATEIDNDYYTIEASTNGLDFTQLGIVKGKGNSSTISTYHFLDRNAVGGITYYRLSQTDFDGTKSIEAITEVNRGEASGITLIQTYPVPFMDELNLQLFSTTTTGLEISLTDVAGRNVLEKNFDLQQGFNELLLSTSSLPKGLYLIAIESKKEFSYQKVMKD